MKHRQHNLENHERKQLCFLVRQGQVCADGVNEALPNFYFTGRGISISIRDCYVHQTLPALF